VCAIGHAPRVQASLVEDASFERRALATSRLAGHALTVRPRAATGHAAGHAMKAIAVALGTVVAGGCFVAYGRSRLRRRV